MKTIIFITILLTPVLIGVALRIFIKKRPRTKFAIWCILMTSIFLLLFYSSFLMISQKSLPFTSDNIANECFVISSIIFLILGFINLKDIKKSLDSLKDGNKNNEQNIEN